MQIPCLNEAQSISSVLRSVPKTLKGVDDVKTLLIDDGSTDETVLRAREAAVDYVIAHGYTRGLAESFKSGQAFALENGFDILVNTDGDDQYFQEKIPQLIAPLLGRQADISLGDRGTRNLGHFGPVKKFFQRVGTRALNMAAGTNVPDAASGFRAYSRFALANLFITTKFSYAMETFIQAGAKGLKIVSVETGAKEVLRPSRLFKSPVEHVFKSSFAIIRGFVMYKPLRIFASLSLIFALIGLIPFVRYAILTILGVAGDHFQSLLVGAVFLIAAAIVAMSGIVADLSRVHRLITEDWIASLRINSGNELPSRANRLERTRRPYRESTLD